MAAGAALRTDARLLLLGARSCPDPASDREVAALASEPIDWPALVELATREGTAPLLHSHLQRLGLLARLPDAARLRLTDVVRGVWAANAALASHWGEATAALRTARVVTLTLKGMALANTVYADRGLRPMADVDLLVRPADRDLALATLRGLGYETPGDAADQLGVSRSFAELVREGSRIDLHWHAARYLRFEGIVDVDHEGLWDRARPLVTAEGQSLMLAPEDLLLHLVLHLTLGSDFARVLWYADIDAVVRRFAAELDWRRLEREADRWRVRELTGWTLGVVAHSFDTRLPGRLLDRLGHGRLRRAAVARLLGASRPPSLSGALGDTRVYPAQTLLMDRVRDVARVFAWTFFPSATWLRHHYALAPWQVPLYRAVHPLRVCWLAARQLG
ncbi:MAG TPA: nucleotidyltransferase family protein [Candidatus Polarisedimenticolaceae bacterium]|nr:nucleotidyltransferase family protein [Candidatus Polarisedimenticolaceae bacterium]